LLDLGLEEPDLVLQVLRVAGVVGERRRDEAERAADPQRAGHNRRDGPTLGVKHEPSPLPNRG
jgi:hypothetical protein